MAENIDPSQAKPHTYQEDFVQSKALFKSSLDQYQKADFAAKKEAFKTPMDEAYNVLQDSASQLVGSHLEGAKTQLAADYAAFQQNDSQENINKLYTDLNQMNL